MILRSAARLIRTVRKSPALKRALYLVTTAYSPSPLHHPLSSPSHQFEYIAALTALAGGKKSVVGLRKRKRCEVEARLSL